MRYNSAYKVFAMVMAAVLALFCTVFASAEESTPQAYSLYSGTPDTSWFSESNPNYDAASKTFVLNTADEFMGLPAVCNQDSNFLAGYTVKLAANLVLNYGSAEEWEVRPPQYAYTPVAEFRGTFDGDGHYISGVFIASGAGNIGLFTTLNGATVKNVAVMNSFILAEQQVGVICGRIKGTGSTVSNVYSDAIIIATKHHAGGIVGALEHGEGTLTGMSYFEKLAFEGSVMVLGGQYAAGIFSNTNGKPFTLSDCINTGHITAMTQRAGGIMAISHIDAAFESDSNVSRCLNAGVIEAGTKNSSPKKGAIIGYHKVNVLNLKDCVAVSDVYDVTVGELGFEPTIVVNETGTKKMTANEVKGNAVIDGWVAVPDSYPMPSETVASMRAAYLAMRDTLLKAPDSSDPGENQTDETDEGTDDKPNPPTSGENVTTGTTGGNAGPSGNGTGSQTEKSNQPADGGCASVLSSAAVLPVLALLACSAVLLGKRNRKEDNSK